MTMRTLKGATLRQAQVRVAAILREDGHETAALDARLLLCHAAGLPHEVIVACGDDVLSDVAANALEEFVARRCTGEPVARILGTREFWGLPFEVNEATLVPRPDSECIVEAAIRAARERQVPLRILDLGTGTGCLLISLLRELPDATGLGIDIAPRAIECATANAAALGVGPRCTFQTGNWLKDVGGQFDLVVSNPPYIPSAEIETLDRDVRDFDPRAALDGGDDGLDDYREILQGLGPVLSRDGTVVMETSDALYHPVAKLMAKTGVFAPATRVDDLAGRARGLRFGKTHVRS